MEEFMLSIAEMIWAIDWRDLSVGILTGIILVGSSIQRTIYVIESKPLRVMLLCVSISFAHYYMVNFAASENISGYVGFSLGSTIVTTFQSMYRKRRRDSSEERTGKGQRVDSSCATTSSKSKNEENPGSGTDDSRIKANSPHPSVMMRS